jgi:hypothetical protein
MRVGVAIACPLLASATTKTRLPRRSASRGPRIRLRLVVGDGCCGLLVKNQRGGPVGGFSAGVRARLRELGLRAHRELPVVAAGLRGQPAPGVSANAFRGLNVSRGALPHGRTVSGDVIPPSPGLSASRSPSRRWRCGSTRAQSARCRETAREDALLSLLEDGLRRDDYPAAQRVGHASSLFVDQRVRRFDSVGASWREVHGEAACRRLL